MDNLENELQKINNINIKTKNPNFKANLRKRIVNEYEAILLSKKLKEGYSLSLFERIYILVSKILLIFKFQSALNLAGLFLFIFSLSAIASYIALPQSIKDNIFKRIGKVDITSNVDGADIYINGDFVGLTPLLDHTLRPGNYSLRIEKEGYSLYSETFSVQEGAEDEIFGELLLENPNDKIYAGWLDYKNSKYNFKFKYPNTWNIVEEVSDDKDFTVKISQDTDWIRFIFNPVKASFSLLSNPEVNSYKRSLSLSGNLESNRFLQFSSEGDYIQGGFIIDQTDKHPKILVVYNLQGKEADALESELLKTMDYIAQSLVVGEYETVMAFDENQWNEKINIEDYTNNEGPEPTIIAEKENTIVLSETYTNDLYGYQIKFPESWDVSTSRAYYPLEDRGVTVYVDGQEYEVARLRIKSGDDGRIYMLTTSKNIANFGEDLNICSNYTASQVVTRFSGYSLISDLKSKDLQQLCSGSQSVFTYNSIKNGVIRYVIYWEIDPQYQTEEVIEEFKEVVESLTFDDNFSNQIIENIMYRYSNNDIGFSFEYPYKWIIQESEESCGENSCKVISLVNDSGQFVLQFFSDVNKSIDNPDFEVSSRTITTTSGELEFKDYYNRICDLAGNCSKGSFMFGIYQNESMQVRYNLPITSTPKMKDILESLAIS